MTKEIERDVLDFDENTAVQDIKIKPDTYIHYALLNAQKGLMKEGVMDAMVTYRIFVEHIEVVCKAAKMIPERYDDDLREFKAKLGSEEKEEHIKQARIANEKLRLLLGGVFANLPASDILFLDPDSQQEKEGKDEKTEESDNSEESGSATDQKQE